MTASVACPSCGGTERRPIAPGYFECVTTLYQQVSTGAHPSGIQGPPFITNAFRCGTRYREGAAEITTKCACGTYSIGECTRCSRPVCGDHSLLVTSQRVCSACRQAELSQAAAEKAAAEARQREQQEAHHAKLVADRRSRYGSEDSIRAQIAALEQIRAARMFRRYHSGRSTFVGLLLAGQLVGWLAYAYRYHSGSQANIPAPPGAPLHWFIGMLVVSTLVWSVARGYAAVKDNRYYAARRRLETLRGQLGCGTAHCPLCRNG
jgi:hypothetical protein